MAGCTGRVGQPQTTPQSYYRTAPAGDTSRELDRVFRSIQRIEFTAEYVTYEFDERAGVTEADILAGAYESRADTSYSETLTKSGTATVIGRSDRRLTLLTVNHVVQFPPVQFHYFEEGRDRGARARDATRPVAAASIRVAERGLMLPRGVLLPYTVTARDERADIALLRVDLDSGVDADRFPVLELGIGDVRRLSWGAFVYVLGYPLGYPMVTRAIVSNPDWDGQGSFITDGIWNEGMSGGPIVAIRDAGRLELIGLARASAAEREIRIRPDTTLVTPGSTGVRYDGPLFVDAGFRFHYGIGLPVSLPSITAFLQREGVSLRRRD